MTQHNHAGITKKPKPREGPYSCPAVYCAYCMERMSIFRWNARSRVAVVEPCKCQQRNAPISEETWDDIAACYSKEERS